MSIYEDPREAVQQFLRTADPREQMALREEIRGEGYLDLLRELYLNNPFLKLTDEELAHFRGKADVHHLDQLIAARDVASKTDSPRIAVFCMPKSGSSFVQTALRYALEVPHMSTTSVGSPGASSFFGMNSREQELDEYAIVKAILRAKGGFVTQNHTRCSMYLAYQLRFYGIRPILTVRNILDCIVSFDDMMISWRAGKDTMRWLSDTQFALPINYSDLDEQARYRIIATSYGVWLISFYLSWKRCVNSKLVQPLVLQYEVDVLNHDRLIQKLSTHLALSEQQGLRLATYIRRPDRERSRINIGVQGRGRQKIDASIVEFLTSYAESFRGELSENELSYLI